MKHKPLSILLALAITSGLLVSGCGKAVITQTITLADLPLESSALVYVAQDKGYFAANGLEVKFKNYDTGVAAGNAVLAGEADIANMTEFVMVRNALDQTQLRIVGSMNRGLPMSLVGLKSRGITTVSSLAGKRIGLTRGTITEFYLGRFLDLHAMSIKDVTLVDLPPAQWQGALASGAVDAASAGHLSLSISRIVSRPMPSASSRRASSHFSESLPPGMTGSVHTRKR